MKKLPCEIETRINSQAEELSNENFVIRFSNTNKSLVKLSRNLQHDPPNFIRLEISNKSIIFRSITFLKWFICDELIMSLRTTPLQFEYGYYQGKYEILGNFHTFHSFDEAYPFLVELISTYAEHMMKHTI